MGMVSQETQRENNSIGEDSNVESDKDEEDLEDDEVFVNELLSVRRDDKKNNTKEDEIPKKKNTYKKKIVCKHLQKGKCFFGLSGRKHYEERTECPYLHPKVCHRLLCHGDKGKP